MKNKNQRGQALPLIAISLGALMGFAGISVDVGYLEYRQQAQQSATDAAALGGAEQLAHGACTNTGNAKAAALSDASDNSFPNGSQITVTPNTPPSSGPFAGNACAVDVQIVTQNVPTYFSRMFGFPAGMTESTHAVAAVTTNGAAPCIYLLSQTVQTNFNGANVNSPQCSIAINDTANFNGVTIGAPMIGYAGAAPNKNGANFTMATPSPMLPVQDPCPEFSGCNYLATNPPSTTNCTSFNGNGYSGTLAAGCYSYLNLNGANVTLQSGGTYVLSGTSNFNGAHVTGTGVTLYVPATGTPPNFNGASVSLSPPTSGNQVGTLYYQVPSNTQSPNFNGTSNWYSGLIYCPGATAVNFNGSGGGYVVLVFGAWNVNGAGVYDFATPSPGQALSPKAVIVQ
ncbi:MAG TPA: Tad domain-containing protein [Candidatus Binatia bacterium]|nr:Tad domain-containing protein [Candidatus Binatia bacterium]